jgi:hypothetical protein
MAKKGETRTREFDRYFASGIVNLPLNRTKSETQAREFNRRVASASPFSDSNRETTMGEKR